MPIHKMKCKDGEVEIRNWEVPSSVRWDNFLVALDVMKRELAVMCDDCKKRNNTTQSTPASKNQGQDKEKEKEEGTDQTAGGEDVCAQVAIPRSVVVVEGFLLYSHSESTSQLFQKKMFLTVPRLVCRHRR